MAAAAPVVEGYVPFRGYRTWYRVVGEGEAPGKLPLLCLHGGPGIPHDYLEPLEAVAETGRRVIFYDQLGCGNSDQPDDPSMWQAPLFVEELGVVREALELSEIHLLGQSWGGMLAMEYALTQPDGLAGLILASSPSSIPLWIEETNRLKHELPPDVLKTLLEHEAAGTTDDPAYQEAMMAFYQRHVCRLDDWPDCIMRAMGQLETNPQVYFTMCGPSEFHLIGVLKDWDVTDRLGEIRVPTLITSGRYDEATPRIAETVHNGIPGSEWVLFEESGHMAHCEEQEKYLGVLTEFLDRVEQGGER